MANYLTHSLTLYSCALAPRTAKLRTRGSIYNQQPRVMFVAQDKFWEQIFSLFPTSNDRKVYLLEHTLYMLIPTLKPSHADTSITGLRPTVQVTVSLAHIG